jgi:hypothetical protein
VAEGDGAATELAVVAVGVAGEAVATAESEPGDEGAPAAELEKAATELNDLSELSAPEAEAGDGVAGADIPRVAAQRGARPGMGSVNGGAAGRGSIAMRT